MLPPSLLLDLEGRGFVVGMEDGKLAVRPASKLTDTDRKGLRDQAETIKAWVTGQRMGESWNLHKAVRMMADADTLVERHGVDGRHPAVVDAAAMVSSAFATRDLETVRFACAEFTATVRGLTKRGT